MENYNGLRYVDLYETYGKPRPKSAAGNLFLYGKQQNLPYALILPGGGYSFVSKTEWMPVVEVFRNKGFNAAVLQYSVYPVRHPAQLTEAAMAVDYLKKQAKNQPIFLVGFSAAGHLSLMLASLYPDFPELAAKPNAVAAVYPVVSAEKGLIHKASFYCLCGKHRKTLMKTLSADLLVNDATCPVCLFHAADDRGVVPENSIKMAEALKAYRIPHTLTIFPRGGHGFSTGHPSYPETATWADLAAEFFKEHRDETVNK